MQKGIMRKFIFLCSILSTSVSATGVDNCTLTEEIFVQSKIETSKDSKPYIPFKLEKSYQSICKIHHPQMMDGLSYLLYKETNSNLYFISLYNGLDGSYTMHGPFSE